MPFVATAYCRGALTASGVRPGHGIAAADPDVLPIGSAIRVEGLKGKRDGVYEVADTGRRIQGRRIDLYLTSCSAAKRFGKQHVRVSLLHR